MIHSLCSLTVFRMIGVVALAGHNSFYQWAHVTHWTERTMQHHSKFGSDALKKHRHVLHLATTKLGSDIQLIDDNKGMSV